MASRPPRADDDADETTEEIPPASAGGASAGGRSPAVRWRDRPAGRAVASALIVVIVAAPAWILSDDLTGFVLFGDDFAYISEARDWPTTRAYLLEPHNAHVVPVFRLWTSALVAMAGRLGALPATMAAASYLGLVAAMAAVCPGVRPIPSRSP